MSPNYHRIHHQLNGPQDVNLGFALSIWDQIFHCAVFPSEDDGQDRYGTARSTTSGGAVHGAPATPLRSRALSWWLRSVRCASRQSPRRFTGSRVDAKRSEDCRLPRMASALQIASMYRWRSWRHGDGGGWDAPALGSVFARDGVSALAPHRLSSTGLCSFARIGLAWIFIYYGAGKLFGWFNGPGIHGTVSVLLADRPPPSGWAVRRVWRADRIRWRQLQWQLGLFSRLAGLALFGDMVMAMITVTWATGINSRSNPPGYQLNLALGVLALVVALLGSGRFSLDALVERRVLAA